MPSARAGCHNLLGNILMSQSLLDEALAEYRKGLRIRRRQKSDVRFSIAILLENIGYTYLLKKRVRLGASMINRALELATEVGARRCIAECCQDLSYAKLHAQGLRGVHGPWRARLDDRARVRLPGHRRRTATTFSASRPTWPAASTSADQYFERLQSLHPELPFLRDFLCTFDLSEILTLKH
jgi:tetratricopeptide (TPR) repeat protein